MEHMLEFMTRYDDMKQRYPGLYLHVSEFSREPKRWRIHVFGRDMGKIGDAEFLCIEDKDREEAFKRAAAELGAVEERIGNLGKIKGGSYAYTTNQKNSGLT